MALTIAVWIIAISLLVSIFAIIVFLFNMQRDLTKTLTQVDITLKELQKNVNVLSEEFQKTLKNTTDITSETKSLVKNINLLTSFNALLQPFFPKTEQSTLLSRLINIAKIGFGIFQGYNFYKKFIGGKNERE